MSTNSEDNSIVVIPSEFDIDNFVIKPIESKSFTGRDKKPVKFVQAKIAYLDAKGQEKDLYFVAPTQECWGITPKYKWREDRTDENIEGLQVSYPVTSKDTVKNPTDEEQAFDNM